MGYRTDRAYEEESRARYRAWKASLTWREYAIWQWKNWSPMLAGFGTGAIMFGALLVLS